MAVVERNMTRFVAKRLVATVIILLILAAAIFALQLISPADPARAIAGDRASEEVLERVRERLGLNDPIIVQYVRYVRDVLHLDLQQSVVTRRPVRTDLAEFIPATTELVGFALLLAVVSGAFLGIASAARWRGASALRIMMLASSSLPFFLTALLLIIVFFRVLDWFPATGRLSPDFESPGSTGLYTIDSLIHGRLDVFRDALRHLILPSVCLALTPAVAIGRALRSSMVATLRADWIRTARAKGLKEPTIVFRHAVRNSLGPALSVGGLQVAYLFGGVVIIEQIFAWPGLGLYTANAISRADFPAVAGVTLFLGAVYVLTNALVDVLQAWADPRIRIGAR